MRYMCFILGLLTSLPMTSAQAQDADAFYKGKSVTLYIGYSAGGGYDLYARLLARHLGDFLPGKPNVVPENMPGAGSLKVAKYISSVAPRDGTAIGTFARGMPFYPLLFSPEFDGKKLSYIGSITSDTSVCITWHTSKIKSWSDIASKPSIFGGEGKGSDPDIFANLIKDQFKLDLKLVTGYPGTADITLAMERGELDGLCGISLSTINSAHSDWLKNKKINIITQAALKIDPQIPSTPSLIDLAVTPTQKQVINLAIAPQGMARPFIAPPDISAERLKLLRKAFNDTMKDKSFLEDAEKQKLDVNPMTGEDITKIVSDLYQTPKDVVEIAANAMGAR
jgi:tripartite-type tricarboxylate transporter receptor subunit TctC